MSDAIRHRWGRKLDDFTVGAVYRHPWEVTLDQGMIALFAASFQDATPLYCSSVRARALGFRERPLHPMLLVNLALSFSVHDVSEQAIAHLAYVDVRFPAAAYAGDTVSARSLVIGVKPSSGGDKGVVHVRTLLETEDGRVVCAFERKALVRAGALAERPASLSEVEGEFPSLSEMERLPVELRRSFVPPHSRNSLPGHFEDFAVGQIFAHQIGRTVGDSEHMQLTTLFRNSHPLHFDALYCEDGSFTKKRVVYGGLVFAFAAALTSRDLAGHALWEIGFDAGAHPSSVAAGDTIYALSKVLAVEERGALGAVTFKLVGVRNLTSDAALARFGDALFEDELGKKIDKVAEKVFEIRRTLLVAKR